MHVVIEEAAATGEWHTTSRHGATSGEICGMKSTTSKALGRVLHDTGLGAALFLLVFAIGTAAPRSSLSFNEALAGEVIATRAVEVTSPPGPRAENAIVAAAQLRPDGVPLQARRNSEWIVLGLTFSLLMAFNLAIWRHLRRVSTSPRQKMWRGDR